MKKGILSLFVLATLSLASCKKETTNEAEIKETVEAPVTSNEAVKFNVDAKASSINWVGSKPTGKHTGTINIKNGELYAKDGVIETGKVFIDMTSIAVTDLKGDEKTSLEGHLKGLGKESDVDHFFNTKKYPEAVFEITKVTEEAGKKMVEGNLTLKDITKSVKFPASITADANGISIESEPFTINRTLWNVNYGSKSVFDNLGDKFINDDIELKVSVKATK
ncbi:YceI family protein [Flavobacterium supellecticarium]|uniref:YceI family protein n=1 Tax=Flavobacterium supellecticarium TaxID=2565924 RepID=A0A4V3W853_9FLAO|nr:YceI family protein [Flavobacterium supellecticarium]THF49930.1 YceI family protein [Flavobacterium supellecticarium]